MTKLTWQTDSAPVSRTWCNIPEGQIVFNQARKGYWIAETSPAFIEDARLRTWLWISLHDQRYARMEYAQAAAEQFYADYLAAKEQT